MATKSTILSASLVPICSWKTGSFRGAADPYFTRKAWKSWVCYQQRKQQLQQGKSTWGQEARANFSDTAFLSGLYLRALLTTSIRTVFQVRLPTQMSPTCGELILNSTVPVLLLAPNKVFPCRMFLTSEPLWWRPRMFQLCHSAPCSSTLLCELGSLPKSGAHQFS